MITEKLVTLILVRQSFKIRIVESLYPLDQRFIRCVQALIDQIRLPDMEASFEDPDSCFARGREWIDPGFSNVEASIDSRC